jgi:hypothetical protein
MTSRQVLQSKEKTIEELTARLSAQSSSGAAPSNVVSLSELVQAQQERDLARQVRLSLWLSTLHLLPVRVPLAVPSFHASFPHFYPDISLSLSLLIFTRLTGGAGVRRGESAGGTAAE